MATSLNDALAQFDATAANLSRLDAVWEKMKAIARRPRDPFDDSQGRQYRELYRDFAGLLKGLPSLNGWSINARPAETLEAATLAGLPGNNRRGASLGDLTDDLDEYRNRLKVLRRQLVRKRLQQVIEAVDQQVSGLRKPRAPRTEHSKTDPYWARLLDGVAEIDRLLADGARPKAWGTLQRHLHFAMAPDVTDIQLRDWPSVKGELEKMALDDAEPLAVATTDLASLVTAHPKGAASTALSWKKLKAKDFERLVFLLITGADGYKNAELLMHTNAPDHGRDLSVVRVREDSLSGYIEERVIIQCKLWHSKSISTADVAGAVAQMPHWEPPPVNVLVMTTTGKFTAGAVAWIEKHNNEAKHPRIEMWPDSRLETLLARRPDLVATFGLR